jgi:predicted Zn finger-like uncharacterized protein
MHITGRCPHCQAKYRLRAYAAGRRARCKTCNQVFVVPGKRAGTSVEDDVVSWLASAPDEEPDEDQEAEEDAESLAHPATLGQNAQSGGARPQAT